MFNRRLYSSGRPTLGLEQSACTDKSPRSTVLPLRNLSAVAAQVANNFLSLLCSPEPHLEEFLTQIMVELTFDLC